MVKQGREIPFQMDRDKPEPVFKSFPGWNTNTSEIKTYNHLPETTRNYVSFINDYLGVKILYISNGPGRDQIVEVK